MLHPISKHVLSIGCQHAFWMKLYAMDVILLMLQSHDLPVVTHSRHFKTVGKMRSVHYPTMVSSHCDSLLQSFEQVIITKLRALCCHPMEHLVKVGQFGTENLANSLMSEAHSQDGFPSGVVSDDVEQQSCLCRYSRSWGENDFVESPELLKIEHIVSPHGDLRSEFPDEMRQVVCEGVVIVYDDYFHVFVRMKL